MTPITDFDGRKPSKFWRQSGQSRIAFLEQLENTFYIIFNLTIAKCFSSASGWDLR